MTDLHGGPVGEPGGNSPYAAALLKHLSAGGYAFGEATRETSSLGGASYDTSIDGWVAGAGVEWAFMDNWSAKVEYQYLDFGDEEYSYDIGGFDPIVDLEVHTIRLGVNWHFN